MDREKIKTTDDLMKLALDLVGQQLRDMRPITLPDPVPDDPPQLDMIGRVADLPPKRRVLRMDEAVCLRRPAQPAVHPDYPHNLEAWDFKLKTRIW